MRLFWKAIVVAICIMVAGVILKSLIMAIIACGLMVPFIWVLLTLGERTIDKEE